MECHRCEPGVYNFQNATCNVCPDNADCSSSYVLPLSGHWNPFPCSHHVQRCFREAACRGASPVERDADVNVNESASCVFSKEQIEEYQSKLCEEGYTGVRCGTCADDYAKDASFGCSPCRSGFVSVLIILLSTAVLVYATWQMMTANLENMRPRWLKKMNRQQSKHPDMRNLEEERMESSFEHFQVAQYAKMGFVIFLQMTLHFVQLMSAMLSMDRPLAGYAYWFLTLCDLISGPLSRATSFSIECLLPRHWTTPRTVVQMWVILLIPLFVMAAMCVGWLYETVAQRMSWGYFLRRCIATVFSVLSLCCIPICFTTFQLIFWEDVFDGVTLEEVDSSREYWMMDPSVEPHVDGYRMLKRFAIALFCMICVVYQMSLGILIGVAQKREALRSDWMNETLGVLISAFNPTCSGWSIAICYKNFYLTLAIVSGIVEAAHLKSSLYSWLLLIAYLRIQPYQTDPNLDVVLFCFMKNISLMTTIATISSLFTPKGHTPSIPQYEWTLFNAYVLFMFGTSLFSEKYEEIKHTLLSEGVLTEEAGVFALLKTLLLHRTKSLQEKMDKYAKKLSPFGRQ